MPHTHQDMPHTHQSCCVVCRRLAVDHEGVRPDILVLGKALSGGTMPVSTAINIHLCRHMLSDASLPMCRSHVCWPMTKS